MGTRRQAQARKMENGSVFSYAPPSSLINQWETDFLPLLVLTRQGRSTGKTSTGNNFPGKYQRIPRNYYQYKFWLRFCLSVLAQVIFKSPNQVFDPIALPEGKKSKRNWYATTCIQRLRRTTNGTIHTKMITNKNLEICFRIRFRNGKANKFPQIFFRICFRNDHIGYAQATTAGHAYEIKKIPEIFFRFRFCNSIERK